jgi:hypothetical protein
VSSSRPLLLAALVCACAGDVEYGGMQFSVAAEPSIAAGVPAGAGPIDIVDGWSLRYDRFLLVLGGPSMFSSEDKFERFETDTIDLVTLASEGRLIAESDDLETGRWDVGYSIYELHLSGELTRPDAEPCSQDTADDCPPTSIRFDWKLSFGTGYSLCAVAGEQPGFTLATGETELLTATIHGDHWLRTGFGANAERSGRRAQWLAECDVDLDGFVTLDELSSVPAAGLFRPDLGYDLGEIPYDIQGYGAILTAYDFLRAQMSTIGGFQGDGECIPYRIWQGVDP